MSQRGVRDACPTARLPSDDRPSVIPARSCIFPADHISAASLSLPFAPPKAGEVGGGGIPVREGRFGDLCLLELGQDLFSEPLQPLETDRFGNTDRQADRYMVEARVAPF